jgi:peptidoglycan/xylan/chitin deacetylase (PgdA/CDA1 family)
MRKVTSNVDSSARERVSARSIRSRMRMGIVGLFVLVAVLAFSSSAMAAPNTTVTFTFDDGRPSQMAAAQQLSNRGMDATFFIISSVVGQPGVMSLSDLNTLEASGMEIAAHTVYHRNLTALSSDEAMRELCLGRNWLLDRGFDIYSFAHPYDATNATVKQLAAACGYNSARTGGQLLCNPGHACAETVPPLDSFSIRTPIALETTTTLADMKAMVTNAENNGGGWVPLEIHDICDGPGDPLLPPGAPCTPPGSVNRALFNQFLDWVKGEVDAGRVEVKTMHEVIGGSLQAEVAVDPAPLRTGNLLLNPSFEQAAPNGGPSACWSNISNGPDTPPAITTTSDAHDGAKALAISVPAGYDSWGYNLIAPSLDLAECSPTAIGGHHYTFTGWYKGGGPIKVVAYWRNADYQWQRLNWGSDGTKSFAAAPLWTKAAFTFEAPAGATAVSAGFYVDSASANHGYTIDETSLVDEDAAPPPAIYALTATAAGAGSIASSPAGIACGATCAADFTDGTSVTLTAVAVAGSGFAGWSGACTGTLTTCTVSMNGAKAVTATFAVLPPLALNVAKAGSGSGVVTSSSAGIDCGAFCQTSFADGVSVTLTAVAAAGSSFTGWSGACSGTSTTCTVSMNGARSVTATFSLLTSALSLVKAGTGNGSVTSNPAGIDCGTACQATFSYGTNVTLTAVAAAGSSFTRWSGACSGTAPTCTVSMNVAKSVTATFTLLPVHLTVVKAGTGSGTVSSNPAGIACGVACEHDYTSGVSVTLTAVAAAGSSFTGWSGACAGSSATCTVSMSVARSITATFTADASLAVVRAGTGSGTVSSNPAGIACGVACEHDFTNGVSVTLTAVAEAGSSFTEWGGACSGASTTCTVSMSVARSVTATFTLLPVELTVGKAGTGSGAVTSNPAGIVCGATCEDEFANGVSVTLTAVAAAGSSFTGWSGECTGTSTTCTVTLDVARSVTATFTLLPVQLTVGKAGTGSGAVTSNPAGIACGASCSASLANGTTVTLTAVAAPGSAFTGWSGACAGASVTCMVSLSVARSVTATFTLLPVHLTVTKAGTGNGTVKSDPAEIACGVTCEADFTNGTMITLTAVAATGSTFTGWSGACSGASTTCTVSLDVARTVTATFTVNPPAPPVSSGADFTPPAAVTVLAPIVVVPVAQAPAAAAAPVATMQAPTAQTRPKLSGGARAGSKLVCTRGTWSGSPARFAFTWRRDGRVVGHGSSYSVKKADRGHSIRCDVTAQNAKGATTAASAGVRVAR